MTGCLHLRPRCYFDIGPLGIRPFANFPFRVPLPSLWIDHELLPSLSFDRSAPEQRTRGYLLAEHDPQIEYPVSRIT